MTAAGTMGELRAALEAHCKADADLEVPEDALLGDFVIVCHWPQLDGDNRQYTLTTHDPEAPDHHAIGLLRIGVAAMSPHD